MDADVLLRSPSFGAAIPASRSKPRTVGDVGEFTASGEKSLTVAIVQSVVA